MLGSALLAPGGVCVLCLCIVVKPSRPDAILRSGGSGERSGGTWPGYYSDHTAHTVLP